nr:MAG TPA: hypothetical protein [Caudoviricetes sp.]
MSSIIPPASLISPHMVGRALGAYVCGTGGSIPPAGTTQPPRLCTGIKVSPPGRKAGRRRLSLVIQI